MCHAAARVRYDEEMVASSRDAATMAAGVAALFCAGALAHCSLALNGLGADPGGSDAAVADATTDDDAEAGDHLDASPDGDAAAGGDSGCPGHGGPASLRVGSFCIDRTEVTAGQYQRFIEALDAGATATLPPACAGKVAFQATSPYPDAGPDLPVVSVDWCDAYAYCAWVGKRLCGKIGGGPTNADASAVESTDQWFAACSFSGAHQYPYGATYLPGACNGLDYDAGVPLRVASLAQCVGGYQGLFDMSGNVLEWVDSCQGPLATDPCRLRGGSFVDFDTRLRCDSDRSAGRATAYSYIGFRCCSNP